MTIDLEELKQKKQLEELLESRGEENNVEQVITAFLVVQNKQGQWIAYSEFSDLEFNKDRMATMDDIVGGCANVTLGCQIQQSAIATVQIMEQRAQQMQQHMLQQQEAQRVAGLIDPKKLRV